ncbi:MAG: hypothetical protein AAF902_15050 [Chloroflexota bacterium]
MRKALKTLTACSFWIFVTPVILFDISVAQAAEPTGVFDGISSNFEIWGWALDLDTPNSSIDVHIYIDNQLVDAVTTNELRPDVNQAYGVSGNHGFRWSIPPQYLDGGTHTIHVYAINAGAGSNQQLSNSPRQYQNTAPTGSLNNINTSFNLTGSASDPDTPNQSISVHFYVDGPAGFGGQLIGSTNTNSSGNFSWSIPLQYRGATRTFYAYGIDSASSNNNTLLSNSPQSPPAVGDAQISNMAGPSDIVIKTTARLAGAIDSLTWNGAEFIDSYDHGRQLQSASSMGGMGECFNPTEAGSSNDGTGPTSTSVLHAISASGNVLSTQTQMAFWLSPGENRPHCGNAVNTTALSNHILNKQVTIGYQGLAHVIEYLTTFTLPNDESHNGATFEATTGYMPAFSNTNNNFDTFWLYDPNSGNLTNEPSLPPVPGSLGQFFGGEQALPVIISTADESYAMGVYSPDLPEGNLGYGRFYFPNENVSKWNCVFREGTVSAGGQYSYRCFVIVGSLENVIVSMNQLHGIFYPSLNPQGDVSCDTTVDATDALYIMEFNVGLRASSNNCPLSGQSSTLNTSVCDVDNDLSCDSTDALYILQCEVGINNILCP